VRFRFALAVSIVLAAGITAAPVAAQQQSAPRQAAPIRPRNDTRLALERQVQQQLWRLTRQRVGLSDAQMRELGPVNQRFEVRRRQILRAERDTRLALRGAVLDSSSADSARVGEQIDRLLQLERQRIDLVQEEQRELAKFMTPVQRAKYMALQEQVRRRVEQMRRRERR
jgi:periplasmic protein CpxP/Spy